MNKRQQPADPTLADATDSPDRPNPGDPGIDLPAPGEWRPGDASRPPELPGTEPHAPGV